MSEARIRFSFAARRLAAGLWRRCVQGGLGAGGSNAETLALDDDADRHVLLQQAASVVEGGQLVFPISLYPAPSGMTVTVVHAAFPSTLKTVL